jgi:hypothetical protein
VTEEQKQILINIGIVEEEFKNYYFNENNQLFTPLKDKNGNMIKTGEQFYNEDYLNPPKPQPTEIELLKQQLLETQTIIAQMQYNSLINTK